jgi:hypothetical protein
MQSTLTVHGLVSKLMTAVDQFRQAHPGQRVRVIIEDIHTCIDRDKLNGAPPRQLHDAAAELLGALVQPLRDGRINMLFTVSESAGVRLILQGTKKSCWWLQQGRNAVWCVWLMRCTVFRLRVQRVVCPARVLLHSLPSTTRTCNSS